MNTAMEHLMYVRGLLKGNEDDRQDGAKREFRRLLLRLLRNKFGEIPLEHVMRIESTERSDLLAKWFDQASVATQLDEVTILPWRERRRKGTWLGSLD